MYKPAYDKLNICVEKNFRVMGTLTLWLFKLLDGFPNTQKVRNNSKTSRWLLLIRGILNSHSVKVAQKPFQTWGHIFAKPKDPVTKEQRTDAIYSISCNDCDHQSIGQTKRQFRTRLKKHQKAVFFCKKENSALSEHICLTDHTTSWDRSKIFILHLSFRILTFSTSTPAPLFGSLASQLRLRIF